MTDEGSTQEPVTSAWTDDEKKAAIDDIAQKLADADKDLMFLLDITLGIEDGNAPNAVPLTLIADGAFISGVAITHSEWLPLHRRGFEGSVLESHFDEHQEWLKTLRTKNRRIVDELEVGAPPREYIYLRDVEVRTGHEVVDLPVMKVYLKNITAWTQLQVKRAR